jgi:hypothetical protein
MQGNVVAGGTVPCLAGGLADAGPKKFVGYRGYVLVESTANYFLGI